MKKYILAFIAIIFLSLSGFGQYSQLQLGDTVKEPYPYIFPFFGKKAYDKGFNLPLPAGLMLNYFVAKQDIVIPEIAIGFAGNNNVIPLTDITRLIEFEEVNSTATSINVRPDLWVFPFLNVYGILGKSWATTQVKLSYPIELEAIAELEGSSYGFGTTGAFGLGQFFGVLDGNWVWSNMKNFEDPVQSSVFSFRIGKAFVYNKEKQANVSLWAGGMRIRMGNVTAGTITIADILPPETMERKDELVGNYYNWYNGVDPLKQNLADKILTPIVDNIDNANGDGVLSYSLTKKPKMEWNMIIGGQWQINPLWQFRAEGGIIGNRKSFLASLNWRFGV